jgi:hypothetical protein
MEKPVSEQLSEVHAPIDWSRGYESLDKEIPQVVRAAEVGRHYVEKLVKVWTKDGVERGLLIQVEVQTTRCWRRRRRRSKGKQRAKKKHLFLLTRWAANN